MIRPPPRSPLFPSPPLSRSARAAPPGGPPLQASGGDTSAPSQVCLTGIAVPFWNAVLDSENAIRPPPFHAPAVASATMSSDGAARRGMALLYKIKPGARTAPRADGSGEVAVTLPPQPGRKIPPGPPRRVGAPCGPCQKTVRAPCQSSARGAFLGSAMHTPILKTQIGRAHV